MLLDMLLFNEEVVPETPPASDHIEAPGSDNFKSVEDPTPSRVARSRAPSSSPVRPPVKLESLPDQCSDLEPRSTQVHFDTFQARNSCTVWVCIPTEHQSAAVYNSKEAFNTLGAQYSEKRWRIRAMDNEWKNEPEEAGTEAKVAGERLFVEADEYKNGDDAGRKGSPCFDGFCCAPHLCHQSAEQIHEGVAVDSEVDELDSDCEEEWDSFAGNEWATFND